MRRHRAILGVLIAVATITVLLGVLVGNILVRYINRRPTTHNSALSSQMMQGDTTVEPILSPKILPPIANAPAPVSPVAPKTLTSPVQQTAPLVSLLPQTGTMTTYLTDAVERASRVNPNARLRGIFLYGMDLAGIVDLSCQASTNVIYFMFCDQSSAQQVSIFYQCISVESIYTPPRIAIEPRSDCDEELDDPQNLPDSDRVMQFYSHSPGCQPNAGSKLRLVYRKRDSDTRVEVQSEEIVGYFVARVTNDGSLEVVHGCENSRQ